jgi:hypothetical protein
VSFVRFRAPLQALLKWVVSFNGGARMGVVDKIFTRVGASDNISQGESTFMTDERECKSILNNISGHQFVVLDEIGHWHSTYDGISLSLSNYKSIYMGTFKPKTHLQPTMTQRMTKSL